MTKRRPLRPRDVPRAIDKMVRDAEARGDFAKLPGFGKPIPGIEKPHDELWWLKQLMQREQLQLVPDSLAVRRELDEAMTKVARASSEAGVRRIVTAINERITQVNRTTTVGPSSGVAPLDEDAIVRKWRERSP